MAYSYNAADLIARRALHSGYDRVIVLTFGHRLVSDEVMHLDTLDSDRLYPDVRRGLLVPDSSMQSRDLPEGCLHLDREVEVWLIDRLVESSLMSQVSDTGELPMSKARSESPDLVEQLQQAGDLRSRGLLTDEEFSAIKARILRDAE